MREKTVRVDPDVPNWLLTKQGGRVLPVVTVVCALIVVASIVAALLVGGGSVTVVTVVVLLAAAGAIAWAVADLVWWTRGGRRAVVRLPRDPRG
ncbi:hypothetical protein SOM11_06365 [Frigoribacterium sp. CFBP9039]|uniref:hypothetical protein n=1 Tax=Frigoribacterium TaxID=96492 RepID=UPI0017838F22|nr:MULTISPECIES: hypothetical protein [Frigoribacterium]MBD8704510.1 hypothetical protein [Frigoribacterium sp. CFBP 13712]MCJ0701860.1 hypothetical protein [Frigoribacterium faeni]MDY0891953.1 hypothetical protein [Frigoribacterium sp. CFBP9030]MDY0945610.1 hypothetical protein [Frigoribacterium sp. CFBP9039]